MVCVCVTSQGHWRVKHILWCFRFKLTFLHFFPEDICLKEEVLRLISYWWQGSCLLLDWPLFTSCLTFDLCICVCVRSPEVDLSDNNLGDYGAGAVADMLKENSTLLSLNLSGNRFTDQSADHLGPALVTNTKLQHLDISHNALGERAGNTAISQVGLVFSLRGPSLFKWWFPLLLALYLWFTYL